MPTCKPDTDFSKIPKDDIRYLASDMKDLNFSAVDIEVLESAVARACREFLRASYAWTYEREEFIIPRGETLHDFPPLDGAQVIKVLTLTIDDRGDEYLLSRSGRMVSTRGERLSWLRVSPAAIMLQQPIDRDLTVRAKVVLIPQKGAELSVPADISAEIEEGVRLLATSYVMSSQDYREEGYYNPVQGNALSVQASRMADLIKQSRLDDMDAGGHEPHPIRWRDQGYNRGYY